MLTMHGETIVDHVRAWAVRELERIALYGVNGPVSFAALNNGANRIAHALRRLPGFADGFIGICLPRTPERIIAALGVLKAGLAYVPIDARLHDGGKRDLAAHCEARAVITQADTCDAFAADWPTLDIIDLMQGGTDADRHVDPGINPGADAPAYIRYTSGSTGAPKGVLHNHRAALGLARGFVESVGLRADDRTCCLTFLPHALVHGCLIAGAAFVCIDPTREGLRDIARRLRAERVTVLSSFPSALRAMAPALRASGPLPDLRCVSLSGEPVTAEDANLALCCVAPGGMATNNYGTSEFVQIAYHWLHHALPAGAPVPVGRAIAGIELRLIGPDGLAVPPGTNGEILLRAPFMSSGYWKRPDLTRAIFGTDTPQDRGTDYRTGDIGRVDADGALHLLGREDNQIKLRGHRVTPEDRGRVAPAPRRCRSGRARLHR